MDASPSVFANWETFYVIVGSSAGALTGLMFVVITLVADAKAPPTLQQINGFATPAVVHFSGVLLLSAVLSAPWRDTGVVGSALGVGALAGLAYMVVVLRRLRQPATYKPGLEDWSWHVVLPVVAYVVLLVAHMGLRHDQPWALYTIAAAALLLLFIGIHNAWDAVIYIAVTRRTES
jgi:hypothetical protein